MDPDELKVRKGEAITPAWRRLKEWVGSLKVVSAPGVRITRGIEGTRVVVTRDAGAWRHPWKASVGALATIRSGTVNGIVPRVRDANHGGALRRLDARSDSGGSDSYGDALPALQIESSRSREGSFILALRVLVDGEGRIAQGAGSVEIVQLDGMPDGTREGGTPDGFGVGYHALAKCYLTEDGAGIAETFQVCHHNLQHRFIPGTTGSGRHLFFPA